MIPSSSREQKCDQIIKAAIRVFSEHGFDRAKMEYIAKEAGIGKGTIYEYFESKESLFSKILELGIEEFRLGLKKSIDLGASFEEKILNCSCYYAQFLTSHMDIVQIAIKVNILPKDIRVFHLAAQATVHNYFKVMVKAAKVNGECRPDLDEELATYCIIGTLDQFCRQRVFCDARPLDEIDHRAIVDVILKGLR
jgi:AcrR family transcriptional regulator